MSGGKGQFYMDLMGSVSDALVVIDEQKRVLSINSAASLLFGAKREGAVGMPCKELVKSELCGDPCPFEESRSRGDTVASFNVRLSGKNEGTPVCMHTSPVKVEGGGFSGVVENIRVITHIQSLIQDLERAYEESEEEKKRIEAILNSIAEAVITIDKNWQITSFNLYAEKITGFTAGEAMGMHCRDVIGLELCGEGCPMEETLKSGLSVSNVETVLKVRGGRFIPVSASTALFRGEGGEVLGGVETYRNLEEIEKIAEERRARTPYRDIVGKTSRIKGIFDLIEVIKDTGSTVLITGESGVGKELFAKAIHDLSNRKKKPFVKVNCAALTESLLESEIFGHVRGAFTGALSDKVGRFESAAGGTIFLDEIGDVPLSIQVKLLRVLQDHEFERVGSSKTVKVDVRVIAATNRDLKKLMGEDKFRVDLFYRLNVIPIHVPPLRERIDDLTEIVDRILSRLSKKGIKTVKGVSPDAMRCLMGYPWPGNVRELENIIERAAVCSRGDVITASELAEDVLDYCRETKKGVFRGSPYARSEEKDISDFNERELILRTLEKNRWNRGETAKELKVDRTTLWRKMKKYGLV